MTPTRKIILSDFITLFRSLDYYYITCHFTSNNMYTSITLAGKGDKFQDKRFRNMFSLLFVLFCVPTKLQRQKEEEKKGKCQSNPTLTSALIITNCMCLCSCS